MRQLDSFAVRITGRLLAIVMATAWLMNGAEELKKPYPPQLNLRPESSGRYSLTVMDGGLLTFRTIPKGITVDEDCALVVTTLREHQPYTVQEACILRFQVSGDVPPDGLTIYATAEPAGSTKTPKAIHFVLLGTPVTPINRFLSVVWSMYGLGALLLLAGAALGRFLWGRQHREQDDDEFRNRSDGRSKGSGGHGGFSALPASTTVPSASVQYASQSDLATVQQSLLNLDGSFKILADAQKRLYSQIVNDLSRFVERCQTEAEDAVQRTSNSALRAAEEVTNENKRIRESLLGLQTELTALHSESRKGLSNLLQALPREALAGLAGAQAGSDLPQKLEQAVARYLREEQPDAQSLASYAQQVGALRSAIMHFKQIASESAASQADPRLDPLDQDLDLIAQELAGFTRQGTDRRFRLLFAVDFSAHETARQTLTEGIAAGLQREIVKLDSFDDYYSKRIGMLAAQVAAECADLADSVLDPQRAKPDVKFALQSVFTVAGVEEIAPRRNDPFLGTDHTMFQMIRRTSAVDRSGAVAQTISRGLRQRDRIVRKATVTLFE